MLNKSRFVKKGVRIRLHNTLIPSFFPPFVTVNQPEGPLNLTNQSGKHSLHRRAVVCELQCQQLRNLCTP
ncbi:hypothetical protein L2E82_08317 [Cichorium intybus]|uniref:Uncharacterized protein n=1 Tax=Cichorium intybus TaxID=13427 RepID=A0ACB9G657_CICIN|nr:hypothetical protein L2E82_08317 [Cichorium intybus]